ncbi:methyltransferase type 11 [Tanacetum coccineum]
MSKFLSKISYTSVTIATLTLLIILFIQTPPQTCIDPITHPKSSCESSQRRITTFDHIHRRLWSTSTWKKAAHSYTTLFTHILTLTSVLNDTNALIMSAGGGQAVMALRKMGVVDVTGFEVVESLPLVVRGDPHHLEFSDGVFGFVFSANLDQALFTEKCVKEMERCVRDGGVIAVCVVSEVKEVVELFRMSRFLLAENVTLVGMKMTMVVIERVGSVS